jgi:hypothetical protein
LFPAELRFKRSAGSCASSARTVSTSATEKQITEHRPACTINAGNLTIEHCAVHAKMFSDPCGKIGKAAEGVSLSGNQFSLAFLDVSERTKSIDLSRSKFPTNRLSDN